MLPVDPDQFRTGLILALLPLWPQNPLRQRLPDDVGAEDEENGAVGVHHDGQVLLRLEEQEGKEAVRQEDQVVDLPADVGGPLSGLAVSQQRLQPGARIQDREELLFKVDDDELEEEGDVVAAVVAVPDRQKDQDPLNNQTENIY